MMLELRDYQERCLERLERYLRRADRDGGKLAFLIETERPYRTPPQFAGREDLMGLPYVCLRVPTGGGKTLLACHGLAVAAHEFLHQERCVCLWLVPSNAILEQTLAALQNRQHPYRQALELRFAGPISVMTLKEALYLQRGTVDGETVVIVSTLAALRVDNTDGRKIYETAGALSHHFSGLDEELLGKLERREDGTFPHSLANVLRLRRPVVVMDEAHNARTKLSFDTLARFSPSCILEFTATPETETRERAGRFASNVLHSVSAIELKAAEMIKMPIRLRVRTNWKDLLEDALETRRELEEKYRQEEKETGEFFRPILLLQAQSKSQTQKTLTVDVIRKALLEDFRIPEEHVKIATGDTMEIDGLDLGGKDCPVRVVITVQALKEGWDCPAAYVLCTVSEVKTPKAVEQILGRILRLPNAASKQNPELNRAYAFAASDDWVEVAESLGRALVETHGFERMDVRQMIEDGRDQGDFLEEGPFFGIEARHEETLPEAPDMTRLTPAVRERIEFDPATGTLAVQGPMSEQAHAELRECFPTGEGREAVERLYKKSHGQAQRAKTPAEMGETFDVPILAIRVDGQLELFEDTHFLDVPWNLTDYPAELTEAQFATTVAAGKEGTLDLADDGRVEAQFVRELQSQLGKLTSEGKWTLERLTNWLDGQYRHPDITRTQSTLFLLKLLENLQRQRGVDIASLARERFRLIPAIRGRIDEIRAEQAKKSYQTLFDDGGAEIEVDPEHCLSLDIRHYSPNWHYDGRIRFGKHFFPIIGELKDEGEEFECAQLLDQMPEVECWVRNLAQRPRTAFWLQTSTGRFYPDFLARLRDKRILVVEYKGKHLADGLDAKEKADVGKLWMDRSGGRCLFAMPSDKNWGEIRAIAGN